MRIYDKNFYKTNKNTAKRSADEVMPYLIERINPKSVIDFGCGGGGWLASIREINPQIKLYGLDGDWIKPEDRMIPEPMFRVTDLTQKIDLGIKCDLALSLEVAEHLDEKYADTFVDNICRHSDVIVFSAAIPLMGGTHHVNEQWPSYWIEKFQTRGYCALDVIRPMFWNNSNVIAAYKQDMILYVKEDLYERMKGLFIEVSDLHIFDIVHPDKYIESKSPDKLINRAWMMNHLPEWLFAFMKKIYLIFGKDRVV